MKNRFEHWLNQCIALGASDLHASAGAALAFRIHGSIVAKGDPVDANDLRAMIEVLLDKPRLIQLEATHGADFGYALPAGERFRVNVYYERGAPAFAIRKLENKIQRLETLGLPPELHQLTEFDHGLVLVTGPTGSGKSTTLATLIDEINRRRSCHILTIEDPIEYVHSNHKSIVHQRQLYDDVPSFDEAVRASLREDPDVILVGEMRDLATMRVSITAAETGHLVFSTLHTGDAVGAIDRMTGAFPAVEQESVRQQLSHTLRAVITQHLQPSLNGKGRVAIVEVLIISAAVSSLIRQNKLRQIYSMIESGADTGMRTLEKSLADLVAAGKLDEKRAKLLARDPVQFDRILARSQAGASSWR